jgi:hypothetical protein
VAARCDYLTMVHGLHIETGKSDDQYTVRIILTSPTASPYFYNLPSFETSVDGKYEARLSIKQHFGLITECNEDNVSTRQCELLCQQKFIHSKCTTCRSSTLNTPLLGVRMDTNLPECTIADYTNCYRNDGKNQESDLKDDNLKQCLGKCQPACSYFSYDLSYAVLDGSFDNGTTLIAPVSDFVEFQQRRAYTWMKVVADCGGLM